MGVPMRTICSKRLVVLNVYTSRVYGPMCTGQLAQRNHRSYLTPLLRFDQVKRRSLLSHFSTNSSRGGDRLATTINLSSRLFRDYKFHFERVTRTDCTRLWWKMFTLCSSPNAERIVHLSVGFVNYQSLGNLKNNCIYKCYADSFPRRH